MNTLKYLSILFTATLAVFAIIKDYKKKDSKKINKTGILLIILILISTIVSIFLDQLMYKDSEAKEKDFKISIGTLTQKNNSLTNNLNQTRDTLKNKIQSLERDNYELSIQLTKSSIELNKNILGEGYATFEVRGSSSPGQYYGGIRSTSKYPLYDVSLLITDFDEAIKCRTTQEGKRFMFDEDCFYKNSTNVKSNTLPPNVLNFVDYNFKSNLEYKNLEIILTTRSVHILQQAVYKLQKGICPVSYRIYEISKTKMKLIKSYHELNLPASYWAKNFYPVENRTSGIYNKQ